MTVVRAGSWERSLATSSSSKVASSVSRSRSSPDTFLVTINLISGGSFVSKGEGGEEEREEGGEGREGGGERGGDRGGEGVRERGWKELILERNVMNDEEQTMRLCQLLEIV